MQTVILDSNPINCKTTIIDEPSIINKKNNRIHEKKYFFTTKFRLFERYKQKKKTIMY